MSREIARSGPVETMRAADADRQQVAEQLKVALDEGRLSLHEYDERVGGAYAARTYADLLLLVRDLPQPGLSAAEVQAHRAAAERREANRLPMAMLVLWTIWGALAAVNGVIYGVLEVTVGDERDIYPWPLWMLVPGAALWAVTIGTQVIRHRQRRS